MLRIRRYLLPLLAALLCVGCMKWDYGTPEAFTASEQGLFVVCEGNFQYGNATLSFYDPAARRIENAVFMRANGFKLGDVAQSMTIQNGIGWVVVCTSRVIFAIDTSTFKEIGRITGFTAPRYIHFLDDERAYVTQLWDSRIAIVDTRKFTITGYIDCPGMTSETGSTEQMVQYGDYVFVNCWSYQNSILVVDTSTDKVVDRIEVGIQPNSIALDSNGKLWVVTDGGYKGSPYGSELPALWRIDAATRKIEKAFYFRDGDTPSEVQLNAARDTLYWINNGIWRMPITEEHLPSAPFLASRNTKYYGLTIDPRTSEVYVADAIDYQQQGIVYRYSVKGELLDQFYTGVTPSAFCWK